MITAKSEFKVKVKEFNYPVLLRLKSEPDVIVLSGSYRSGMVVSAKGGGLHQVGYHSDAWVPDAFEFLMPGETVTLSNEEV